MGCSCTKIIKQEEEAQFEQINPLNEASNLCNKENVDNNSNNNNNNNINNKPVQAPAQNQQQNKPAQGNKSANFNFDMAELLKAAEEEAAKEN